MLCNCPSPKSISQFIGLLVLSPVAMALSVRADTPLTRIQVQKGDTLSGILARADRKPIYGKQGALEKTLTQNPLLQKQDGNLIWPGQEISIPEREGDQQSFSQTELPDSAKSAQNIPATESPVLEAPPVPEDAARVPDQDYVRVNLELSNFTLESTQRSNQARAKISTLASPGFSLEYVHEFHQTFLLGARYRYSALSFDELPGRDFQNRKVGFSQSELYLVKPVGEFFTAGVAAGWEQALLLRSFSANELRLDQVGLMTFGPKLDLHLQAGERTRAQLSLQGKYFLGKLTSLDQVNSSLGYLITPSLTHSIGEWAGIVGVSFEERRIHTTLVNADQHHWSFSLGLKRKF